MRQHRLWSSICKRPRAQLDRSLCWCLCRQVSAWQRGSWVPFRTRRSRLRGCSRPAGLSTKHSWPRVLRSSLKTLLWWLPMPRPKRWSTALLPKSMRSLQCALHLRAVMTSARSSLIRPPLTGSSAFVLRDQTQLTCLHQMQLCRRSMLLPCPLWHILSQSVRELMVYLSCGAGIPWYQWPRRHQWQNRSPAITDGFQHGLCNCSHSQMSIRHVSAFSDTSVCLHGEQHVDLHCVGPQGFTGLTGGTGSNGKTGGTGSTGMPKTFFLFCLSWLGLWWCDEAQVLGTILSYRCGVPPSRVGPDPWISLAGNVCIVGFDGL